MVIGMNKDKVRIAIIDDFLSDYYIKRCTDNGIYIKYTGGFETINLDSINKVTPNIIVSHGIVCCAILLEFLYKYNIIYNSEIEFISISNEKERYDLEKCIKGVEYCIEEGIDILSFSLGIQDYLKSRKLNGTIAKARQHNIYIIAANANNDKVSYPACLNDVLGVKIADKPYNKRIYKNSKDGIDVVDILPKVKVLEKLYENYNITVEVGNSLLVPIIAAEVAQIIYLDNTGCDLEKIKKELARHREIQIQEYGDETVFWQNSSINIPIILLNFKKNEDVDKLLLKLQDESIHSEYHFLFFREGKTSFNFNKNIFYLPINKLLPCIHYYSDKMDLSAIFLAYHINDFFRVPYLQIDAVIGEKKYQSEFKFCPYLALDQEGNDGNIISWLEDILAK